MTIARALTRAGLPHTVSDAQLCRAWRPVAYGLPAVAVALAVPYANLIMPPMKPRLVNLDLDLLRSFVTIAELRSFTRAGMALGRSQSAISLQIKRLEVQVGVALLKRDPRHVALTADGEALLAPARRLLRLNDDLVAGIGSDALDGEVRLGAPEDFATVHLPGVLGSFARAHPRVTLNVTCDLTLNLLDALAQGRLDLALVKREPLGPDLGVRVWREPLVWAAAGADIIESAAVLPLVVAPAPCVYRSRAVAAAEYAGLPLRIAYVSPSLAGQHAALRAGLGVAVLPREMVPDDLHVFTPDAPLPRLPDSEIALLSARGRAGRATERLAEAIRAALAPTAV